MQIYAHTKWEKKNISFSCLFFPSSPEENLFIQFLCCFYVLSWDHFIFFYDVRENLSLLPQLMNVSFFPLNFQHFLVLKKSTRKTVENWLSSSVCRIFNRQSVSIKESSPSAWVLEKLFIFKRKSKRKIIIVKSCFLSRAA